MTYAFWTDWLLRVPDQWEYLVLYVAAALVLWSVLSRFVEAFSAEDAPVLREHNAVATLSMVVFFWGIYCIGRFNVGRVPTSLATQTAAKIVGCLLVVAGAVINVAARRAIGPFWSDQIEIQPNHRIVRQWPYTWARHPMYGSLVFFAVGMGLLAVNPVVVVATLGAFLPALVYRALREERRLEAACGHEYEEFQGSVPMILPRLPEPLSKAVRAGLGMIQLWGVLVRDLHLFLLSAVLTLGLSFVMQRKDFRTAYKVKAAFILLLTALATLNSQLVVLLWIPVCASFMSLTGHCPGTLVLGVLHKNTGDRQSV